MEAPPRCSTSRALPPARHHAVLLVLLALNQTPLTRCHFSANQRTSLLAATPSEPDPRSGPSVCSLGMPGIEALLQSALTRSAVVEHRSPPTSATFFLFLRFPAITV
ncbi:hypothetical protein NL676_007289 [Syzygium grande]|nr:hypothetical protein NL676_007289 [Syzygium grande]